MKLDMTHSQDSYSMAAMERMKIELEALVKKLNEVGSALATLNLFRRADIELEGKKRRLRDFAEIDLGPDPMAGTFKVIIHNEVAIPGAISILKENNFINNTFIIFVSDHGDGQGDHYHWRKGYPYEFSSHVPFIIHWPETILSWKRGQIREEVVELRDLFPTFLDIANGTNLIPNDINGSSILDLLRRSSSSSSSSSSKKDIIDGSDVTTATTTSWRQWIDLEHDICYNITNHWNALTDGKMKYIYRAYFGDEQLFNLTNDQYEMNDLSKDNKYIDVLEMWRKRLVQQFVNEQRGVSWVNDEGKLMKRVQGMLYSRYYPK